MSSQASAFSIDAVRELPAAARLNACGLALAAAGMFVQIAAGSTLYPSIAGPTVLIATALLVVFGPRRPAAWVGFVVPLVLGLGAIAAAVMTGDFIDQLTDLGRPGLVAGSVMHVVGLGAAIAGGLAVLLDRARSAGGASAS